MTTRPTPAAITASEHGGVRPKWLHGSSVTYSVAPRARSPAAASATTSACEPPNFACQPSPTTAPALTITEPTIDSPAVIDGRGDLDTVERAVVRLADTVAAGAADMKEDDLAELRGLGLDDAEILDVVLAAAARCFFSKTLDALGCDPDAAFNELIDPELREALTVGRPIEAADAG